MRLKLIRGMSMGPYSKASIAENPLLSAAGLLNEKLNRKGAPTLFCNRSYLVKEWIFLAAWMLWPSESILIRRGLLTSCTGWQRVHYKLSVDVTFTCRHVNEIGVTAAGLWPCIFCRLIVALRNHNIRVTECGHYASFGNTIWQANDLIRLSTWLPAYLY